MIPSRLKLVLLCSLIIFLVIVFALLKRKRLALRYTLLWLLTAVVLLIFVIFPELLVGVSRLLGIQTTMNTLYILLIGFLIILTISLTSIVSGQKERIRVLTQQSAVLDKRIRELEKKEIEGK